jgi:hypothetical protein
MLRNFRKFAHRDASPGDSVWNWLAVAQHHGLPTRLLDWTLSPYVALHFATDEVNKHHTDGAIWCLNGRKNCDYLPESLQAVLKQEHSMLFDVRMLDRVAGCLKAFDEIDEKKPFLLLFEPPALDDRIVNQRAVFSIMSSPTIRADHWLENEGHGELLRRIIIPAALKPQIRDYLDMMNVTERVLFGGLDGLSTWLTRHYTPTPSHSKKRANPPWKRSNRRKRHGLVA